MSVCEMCGKEASLINADVEGVELKVCSGCAKYGANNQNTPKNFRKPFSGHKNQKKAEVEWKLVSNFSDLIKSAREKKGMNQEDFAKFLNEKESILSKWEQGTLKPRIFTARRLEKVLNVSLVAKDIQEKVEIKKDKSLKGEFTLGDFIKVRKRHS